MANVRIKDLTTTAATTASDDFFGVDGATNGTRKLNAYSPTFGGNLTVSGTGTFGNTLKSSAALTQLQLASTAGTGLSSANLVEFLDSGGTRQAYIYKEGGSGKFVIGNDQSSKSIALAVTGDQLTVTSTATTLAGNLTVSGTGTSSVAGTIDVGTLPTSGRDVPVVAGFYQWKDDVHAVVVGRGSVANPQQLSLGVNQASNYSEIQATQAGVATNKLILNRQGGNVLIGTTIDTGQKLQVSGAVAATKADADGGISLTASTGTNPATQTITNSGGTLRFGLDNNIGSYTGSVYPYATIIYRPAATALVISRAGTSDLTIGTTGDATFAGKITANGAGSTFKGTATNDNAAAGYVGEFVSSAVVSGSAVSLTNATAANITSISLTAGDWDVTGLVQYNFTGATCSYVYHGFSSASAAFGAPNSYVQDYRNYTTASVSTHNPSLTFRISLAATTTIYFVTQADFSAGTVGAYGRIQARRVR